MNKIKLFVPLLVAALLISCTSLSPNADPIVVRAEQSISVAFATLDTFVKLDNSNRALWKEKFPVAHTYAEYLRAPVGVPPVQRGISWVESATRVKDTYKKSRTPENKVSLVTALATLDTALVEVQKQLDSTKP